MIKLIASDLDGTLLPEGTTDINPELYDVIRSLTKQGIRFVAASGRQYSSMLNILTPVKDDIVFISDNGANVVINDQSILQKSLTKELLSEIEKLTVPLDVFILAATPHHAYTLSEDVTIFTWLRDGYGIEAQHINHLSEIDEPVLKIALYSADEDAAVLADSLRSILQEQTYITASGDHWVDIMAATCSKGDALKELQAKWNILPKETMAFGDNNNDISLLLCTPHSYAVESARPEVKEIAGEILTGDLWDCVLNVLKKQLI